LNDDMEAVSGATYYAAQIIDGCESVGRTAVTVEITSTDMPAGDQTQEITVDNAEEATIADLGVDATGTVTWYTTAEDAEEGENPLSSDTVLVSGTTYYATQTIDGCESLGYAVTATVTLGNGDLSAASFSYHPNPVKDVLTLSYDRNISSIEVYNIVGQQVMVKMIGQNETTVDMSQLSAGTYLVKVMGDSASKTIKVVKQ
ncbi:T9SS type A sorting domain-containing protein, partial [Flavobacterium sp.]